MITSSIIDTLLYFICNLAFSIKILNGTIKRKFLIFILIGIYSVLIVLSAFFEKLFFMMPIVTQILGTLCIKFSVSKVKIFSIIYFYIFICMNNAFISYLIATVLEPFNVGLDIVEPIVNGIISVIFLIAFFDVKVCGKIQLVIMCTSKKIKLLMLLYVVTVTFIFSLLYDSSYFSNQNSWNLYVRILFIAVMALVLITIPVLILSSIVNKKMKIKNDDYEEQLQAQAKHYNALSKSNYELRKFRHDYKQYQAGISRLISKHKYDEALDLLEQCDQGFYEATDAILKYDTGNGIADALLMEKQEEVADEKINIEFHGSVTPKAIEPRDICVIFGNTIDNAIEACRKLPEDIDKNIFVDCHCNSGIMFLKITNPVNGNVEIKDNFIATSKEDKTAHGFGIYSLKTVLKKYDGEVKFSCDNNTFCAKIDMYLNV
jgi:hypothetical protein